VRLRKIETWTTRAVVVAFVLLAGLAASMVAVGGSWFAYATTVPAAALGGSMAHPMAGDLLGFFSSMALPGLAVVGALVSLMLTKRFRRDSRTVTRDSRSRVPIRYRGTHRLV